MTFVSEHSSDSVFGAQQGTFSRVWAGVSWVAPDPDPVLQDKIVRWSLSTAAAAPPACPVLILVLLSSRVLCSVASSGTIDMRYCDEVGEWEFQGEIRRAVVICNRAD